MKSKKDHPGVYVPPPMLYAMLFLLSVAMQKFIPLSRSFFELSITRYLRAGCILCGVAFVLPALITFLRTKNTLITIKPAKSLQTSGIYSLSRNPMYTGLLFIYCGVAFVKGNWWTFIFIPLVVMVVTMIVIIREENYLTRAFGQDYLDYKKRVRRWM